MSIKLKLESLRNRVYEAQEKSPLPIMQAIHFLSTFEPKKTPTENYNKYIVRENDPIIIDYLETAMPLLVENAAPSQDTDLFNIFIASKTPLIWTDLDDIERIFNFFQDKNIQTNTKYFFQFWRPLLTNVSYSRDLFSPLLREDILQPLAEDPDAFHEAVEELVLDNFSYLKKKECNSWRSEDGRMHHLLNFDLIPIVREMSFHLRVDWYGSALSYELDEDAGLRIHVGWHNVVEGYKSEMFE